MWQRVNYVSPAAADVKDHLLAKSLIDFASTPGSTSALARVRNLIVAQDPLPPLGYGNEYLTNSEDLQRWKKAKRRFDAVVGFLQDPELIRDIERHAKEAGVHVSTLYRWVHQYQQGRRSVVDFMDQPRASRTHFLPEVEQIIESAIGCYKGENRPSQASIWRKVRKACRSKGLDIPHINTIRLRIGKLPAENVIRARFGKRVAAVRFNPQRRGFPAIDGPLCLVQIDHTPVDLILLDEESREPIGRPHITVVLDTYSRVVLGFYLTLDDPGALSVGLALLHAILPKKPWLDEIGIELEWPFHGLPRCIFVDNAMEFRGKMLRRWAENYGCDLQFRALKVPETGAHIERFLRTLSTAVHEIPGSTFSNPQERGDYPSMDRACMTIREFEGWLARWMAIYHASPHRGLDGKSPSGQWLDWFRRNDSVGDTAQLVQVPEPVQLRMSLLPFEERTIQQYGVRLFGEIYYHDVLRRYFHSTDPEDPRRKKKYIIRFDPREISRVYFLDPGTSQYFPIPWRNPVKRPCSLWEQRYRLAKSKAANRAGINDQEIDEYYEDLERREEEAKAKTLAQRRTRAKQRLHAEDNVHRVLIKVPQIQPEGPVQVSQGPTRTPHQVLVIASWREIIPYPEIE